MSLPLVLTLSDPHRVLWALKSPSIRNGFGSWEVMLFRSLRSSGALGGMYMLHMAIVLCKVTRRQVTWRLVFMMILLEGISFLIRMEEPPEALFASLTVKWVGE